MSGEMQEENPTGRIRKEDSHEPCWDQRNGYFLRQRSSEESINNAIKSQWKRSGLLLNATGTEYPPDVNPPAVRGAGTIKK